KGGSKVVLFGVAAVASLGIVGFLAFQQGWIGAGAASEPAPMDVIDNASRLATHVPAPENSGLALQPPAQDIVEQEPVEAATPVEIQSVPVEIRPAPAENVPPRPVVPPQPTFKRRSAGELRAARDRQAYADQALLAAAGSLQSQLLSEAGGSSPAQDEPIEAVDLEADDLIGIPVRPEAPEAPKARYGELFDIDDVDRAPARVRFEQPVYDELARRMHQQGVVLVEVLIDETGQVTEARLLQEIPRSRLNEASLRAARRWSYFPAVKDGVPVKVWKTERIVFELE
ncbi:MAG: energy transducer TonB, partial [Acidobacteriota bacterium]